MGLRCSHTAQYFDNKGLAISPKWLLLVIDKNPTWHFILPLVWSNVEQQLSTNLQRIADAYQTPFPGRKTLSV
jgi:hypothetical protein